MIEHRPFDALDRGDRGWLKSWRHFAGTALDRPARGRWGCLCLWNDEEIPPNAGYPMQTHADVEIVTYVREGTMTHRDSLGNEGRIEAGGVQVVSAGSGIRHAEYNLEQVPARIFQLWMAPRSPGGSPAWAVQPRPAIRRPGAFAAIASGSRSDHEALPIRAHARVMKARLNAGDRAEYSFGEGHLAYLVPCSGEIRVDDTTIFPRDGASISDMESILITAIEDTDIVMVDMDR